MGSGVGVSINSKARIATDRSMFAMPEASIGLFTDIGAGYFLPRTVNNEICFGLYLSLTGRRVIGKDLVHWGLATHYVPDENLDDLKKALKECKPNELNFDNLMEFIDGFATLKKDKQTTSQADKIPNSEYIRRVFKADSIS